MENRRYTRGAIPTHSFRRTVGVFCLGLGSVGLLLPFVPGIPLLIIGGLLLRRRESSRNYDHGNAYAYATPTLRTDPAPLRGRQRVRPLSGAERLELAFWRFCLAITTRLDARSRTSLRTHSD